MFVDNRPLMHGCPAQDLLMDALCVTAPAVEALCHVISQTSLRRLHVDPSSVVIEAPRPPYNIRVPWPEGTQHRS